MKKNGNIRNGKERITTKCNDSLPRKTQSDDKQIIRIIFRLSKISKGMVKKTNDVYPQ